MKKIRLFLHNAIIFSFFIICFLSCSTSDVTVPFSSNPDSRERTEIVSTKTGHVRGIYSSDNSTKLFAGIPYAKPPVGELRWKEPQDISWTGICEADHFAPVCYQVRYPKPVIKIFQAIMGLHGSRTDFAPMSEDCLYLNIWRPSENSENLPVLVYIHGGGLMTGASWTETWDGEAMSKKGIVVVTIAYRLGIFGYYADEDLVSESPNGTTGNYGLLDQIKALEWVKENIGFFGGDSDNITIAGESAGSSSVNALCASPLTKGLFKRAIGESSSLAVPVPAHTFRPFEEALAVGKESKESLKAESVEELRKIPAEKLLKAKGAYDSMTVDGYALTEYPWETYKRSENHEEALLNGYNSEEGKVFTMFLPVKKSNLKKFIVGAKYVKDVDGLHSLRTIQSDSDAKTFYTDIFAAVCFGYPHHSWTNIVSAQGKPVFEYYFSKDNRELGPIHTGEIPYAYGNLGTNENYKKSDHKLESVMTEYWANFIKYGDPNGNPADSSYGKVLPFWKDYSDVAGDNRRLLELGNSIQMIEDPLSDIYAYFDFNIDKNDRPNPFKKEK